MKYTVKAQVPVTGRGWGLDFVEGVAHTDDEALAAKLAGKGYTVTEVQDEKPAKKGKA